MTSHFSKEQLEEIYQYVKMRQVEEAKGFMKEIEKQRKKFEKIMRSENDATEEEETKPD